MVTVAVIGVVATTPVREAIVNEEASWAVPNPVKVLVPLTAIVTPPDAELVVAVALNVNVELV